MLVARLKLAFGSLHRPQPHPLLSNVSSVSSAVSPQHRTRHPEIQDSCSRCRTVFTHYLFLPSSRLQSCLITPRLYDHIWATEAPLIIGNDVSRTIHSGSSIQHFWRRGAVWDVVGQSAKASATHRLDR
jgi:hypothetical protein